MNTFLNFVSSQYRHWPLDSITIDNTVREYCSHVMKDLRKFRQQYSYCNEFIEFDQGHYMDHMVRSLREFPGACMTLAGFAPEVVLLIRVLEINGVDVSIMELNQTQIAVDGDYIFELPSKLDAKEVFEYFCTETTKDSIIEDLANVNDLEALQKIRMIVDGVLTDNDCS